MTRWMTRRRLWELESENSNLKIVLVETTPKLSGLERLFFENVAVRFLAYSVAPSYERLMLLIQ